MFGIGITRDIRCAKCGYRLSGLPSNICPECGQAFDVRDPTSYVWRVLNGRAYLSGAILGSAVMFSPLVLLPIVRMVVAHCGPLARGTQDRLFTIQVVAYIFLVAIGWLISGSSIRTGRAALRGSGIVTEHRGITRAGYLLALLTFLVPIIVLIGGLAVMVITAICS